MELVAGVDGCRGGWIALVAPLRGGIDRAFPIFAPTIDVLMGSVGQLRHVALDIPIGLPDEPSTTGRECDRLARARLGRRGASVFPPPSRGQLAATDYETVRTQGMSKQTFHILGRIREIDAWITPAAQRVVRESHPEVCFLALAGERMRHPKRTAEGREERLATLEMVRRAGFSGVRTLFDRWRFLYRRSVVAHDDLIDAIVLTELAWRMAEGRLETLPADPPADARGLRMEICAPLGSAA